MREIMALGAGFLLIVVMLFKKVQIGTTMLAASMVMGILAGFGPKKTLDVFITSAIARETIELLAVVTLICILCSLLQKYGILDKMADSLEDLFNNNRFSIMLLPLLVGVLFIPGGAVMSAPVVDSVGDKLGIDSIRKAAINVVFRHALYLLFPFSATIVLAGQLAGLSPYAIIKYNIPVALVALIAGYVLYIRNIGGDARGSDGRPEAGIMKRIWAVLLYTSPLWVCILINLAFGVPFYLALVPGVVLVYFLAGEGKENFIKDTGRGINWMMLYSITGIMILQGFIRQMPEITRLINSSLESGTDIRLLIMISAAAVGFLTANNTAVVGMLFPLFLPLAADTSTKALLASLIFVSGYIAYYVSPLHLCQVFTAEYFKVKVNDLYREYRVYWPLVIATVIVLFMFVY